jgi:DNA-binding transcriptional ArsR family regulator
MVDDDEKTSCEHEPSHRPRVGDAIVERAAQIFRALGDKERLSILERLRDGEACVSEIAEDSGAGLSTVSQRLRQLRSEGLVVRRRDGKHIFYALADEHVAELVENGLAHAAEH